MASIDFTGNLAADPEIWFTPSGKQVTRLVVIENLRRRNSETREWEDAEPNRFHVQAFRTLGENVAESLRKGQAVSVKGRIMTDRWRDKETGEDRTSQVVLAAANRPGPQVADRPGGYQGPEEEPRSCGSSWRDGRHAGGAAEAGPLHPRTEGPAGYVVDAGPGAGRRRAGGRGRPQR